ncbi:MAG: hypothetical protein GY899_10365, partial [Verrucomicrobiaceae bacterium]|nr:hypothetical protein [Verrucomicrobiaceae bacterium]
MHRKLIAMMNILFITEQQNVIQDILVALKQSEGLHKTFTAPCFESARRAIGEVDTLDALITVTFTSNGSNAFDLRDEFTRKFPNLRVAFLNNHDLSGWTKRLGQDTVFGNPPDKKALLEWLDEVMSSNAAERKISAPETIPEHPLPLQIVETGDENDEDLPIAETVTAPGKHLGDYELVRFIGGDDTTETHEALQLSIDRPVALVLLKPEFTKQKNAVRTFRG